MKGREPDEPEDASRPPGAAEILYLREVLGISRPDHAERLGHKDDSLLRKYERGKKPLSRGAFAAAVEPIGHSPEAVDALLALHPLLTHLALPEPPSPVALRRDELVRVDRACLGAVAGLAECFRPLLAREARRLKAAAARREAAALWPDLAENWWKERRLVVETWPRYRTWAMAERACEASIQAAAHRADLALDLAVFALFIADRLEESLRPRAQGYCWGHIANARRVGEDFDRADRDFAHAWHLWRAGADTDPELFPEWKLLSLEASLRRAQHRFSDALDRLELAQARCGGDREAQGRLLLMRSKVYEHMGDAERALAALDEADPLLEGAEEARLLSVLSSNRVHLLFGLERYREAADLLPQARRLAKALSNDLDLIRLKWLDSKICDGFGDRAKAMDLLQEVCDDFTDRGHPYDAALSLLDLAVLKLEAGHTREVRWVAAGLARIFTAKKIAEEALSALRLFYEAAIRDAATVELARQVIADVERARRSAPRSLAGEGPWDD